MKASYETNDGDDQEQADGDGDSYFTMKDGDCFYATGQDKSNENQGGADGYGHRFDGPVEEMQNGLYLGEKLGICDEEAMIQDEMNILMILLGRGQ